MQPKAKRKLCETTAQANLGTEFLSKQRHSWAANGVRRTAYAIGCNVAFASPSRGCKRAATVRPDFYERRSVSAERYERLRAPGMAVHQFRGGRGALGGGCCGTECLPFHAGACRRAAGPGCVCLTLR